MHLSKLHWNRAAFPQAIASHAACRILLAVQIRANPSTGSIPVQPHPDHPIGRTVVDR
ncbi:MAG: hypothetical protein WCA11_16170 [Terracidiphilus sp.]